MYCITEAIWFFKFEVPSWKINIMIDEMWYLISIFEVAISALESKDCNNFVCDEHLATDISRRDLEALQLFIRGWEYLL